MKTSEYLKFNIWLYSECKTLSFPTFKIYFDGEQIIEEKIKECNKSFNVSFEKDCVFGKHSLEIHHVKNLESKENYIKVNNIVINFFEAQKHLINEGLFLHQNKILEVKNKMFLRADDTYRFSFESPYAYYFLKRI